MKIGLFVCIIFAVSEVSYGLPVSSPDKSNSEVTVLDSSNTNSEYYRTSFVHLSDGQKQMQEINLCREPEEGIQTTGFYEFTAPNGQHFRMTYTADLNGTKAKVSISDGSVSTTEAPKMPEEEEPYDISYFPAKPQSEDGIGCALRNSLCG